MEILRKVRNHFAHNWEGVSLARNDIAAMVGQLSGYTFHQERIEADARAKLHGSLTSCCVELHIFLTRLEAGKHVKAPDVSHRLTTVPPIEAGRPRFVK